MCSKNGILDDWFGIETKKAPDPTPAPSAAPAPAYTPADPPKATVVQPQMAAVEASDQSEEELLKKTAAKAKGRAALRINRTGKAASAGIQMPA